MKLKKLFALALCFAMCMSCLAAFGSASANDNPKNGLYLSKSVKKVDGPNNDYMVTLKAHTDGTSGVIPTDIVLVLEESQWMSTTMYEYKEVYTLDTEKTYYVASGDSYSAVNWCDKENRISTLLTNSEIWSKDPCNGWYGGTHLDFIFLARIRYHWGQTKYEPKTSATDNTSGHVQFYERKAISTTKIDALAEAAEDFVDAVLLDANTNGVAHRVAVVSYSDDADIDVGLTADIRENSDDVYDAIDGLTAAEGSNLNAALTKAETAFDEAVETLGDRNKVIVVYSYGVAGTATKEVGEGENKITVPTWDATAVGIADNAIGRAKELKTAGITIYTVGMGDDVDPTLDVLDKNADKSQDIYRTNAFLHFVSSNFPNAIDLETSGSGSISDEKYISALDTESLNEIFDKVKEEFNKPSVSLDANAQIRDVVSQYFSPVSGSVKVYTTDYDSRSEKFSETRVDVTDEMTITLSGQKVTVSGFDFDEHFVGMTGGTAQMLIVEFKIQPIGGFLGGNRVPTNVYADSGVFGYNSKTKAYSLAENFEKCYADVPINYNVSKAQDVTVYRGNQVGVTDLYTIPAVGGIYNDFVTVEYMVNGQTVSVGPEDVLDTKWFNALSSDGCADFPLTGTVKPVNAGPVANASITPETAKVHVLNPILDGTDVTIWQGNNTKLAATTDWKCTCVETFKTPADATEGLAALDATTPVFTEKGKTDAVITASPADCTQYTVAFTANNIPYSNDFWVHVRTVSFTMNPKTIYLSEVVDVAAANRQVKSVVWQETACDCKDMILPEVSGSKGATSVVFDKEGETAYIQPGNCTTPDVYLKIGDKISNVKAPFTVHVLKPTVATGKTTIFLGDDAELTGSVASWACRDEVTGGSNSEVEAKINWAFMKADDDGNATSVSAVDPDNKLTECTPTVAVGTLYGQTFTSDPVMVHVVLPTVTGTEATIKMGNPAPLAATTEWGNKTCKCGDASKPKPEPEYPLGSKFYDTDGKTVVTNYGVLDGNPSYPSSCHTYIAAALVNGVEYTFDGNRDNFMIHVQTPVVTGTDTAIYLGNDTTLAAEITDWNVCKSAEGEEIGTHGQSLTNSNEANPEHSFIYTDKETNTQVTTVSPVTCKPYTVGLKTIGGVILEGTEYQDEFTVHVYVPQFTVTTQDLWADCGENVDLNLALKSDPTWTWVDRKGDDCTLPAAEPKKVSDIKVQFDPTSSVNPLGEYDVDVNVNSLTCKVNGVDYTAVKAGSTEGTDKQLMVKPVDDTGHDFTVHVNKFKAVITNNGTQNAIYTLSGGTLKSNIQIAVPAGGNVTVSGLLCGKDEKGNSLTYTVTEEENENSDWTWRYSVPAEKQTISKSIDGVNIEDSKSKVDVSMTYQSVTNAKWLADEDCVVNKATTQATITNPALSVKKKDEEVTNA